MEDQVLGEGALVDEELVNPLKQTACVFALMAVLAYSERFRSAAWSEFDAIRRRRRAREQ
jgi:hypothetical protein